VCSSSLGEQRLCQGCCRTRSHKQVHGVFEVWSGVWFYTCSSTSECHVPNAFLGLLNPPQLVLLVSPLWWSWCCLWWCCLYHHWDGVACDGVMVLMSPLWWGPHYDVAMMPLSLNSALPMPGLAHCSPLTLTQQQMVPLKL